MNKSLFLALLCSAAPVASAPVVVELFTSQGCSSCPSADELLSTWGRQGFLAGELIPLSFNVDYWNYLGWRDLFSAPSFSARQRRYAAALGSGVYTPMMVVAGKAAFVGSDGGKARAQVERFRVGASSRVSVSLENGRLLVRAAGGNPQEHVMLALFENGLVTKVASGENGGRALRNDFVVRRLVDLGEGGANFERRVPLAWDVAWDMAQGGAAVFVQDPETMEISGAAAAFPLSRAP
jgi:hypothetical protein